MAKGKTNQPLTIVVADEWIANPAVFELYERGHRVQKFSDHSQQPDLILHPAGGWDEALFEQFRRENGTLYRPYLDARIAWARARKRAART